MRKSTKHLSWCLLPGQMSGFKSLWEGATLELSSPSFWEQALAPSAAIAPCSCRGQEGWPFVSEAVQAKRLLQKDAEESPPFCQPSWWELGGSVPSRGVSTAVGRTLLRCPCRLVASCRSKALVVCLFGSRWGVKQECALLIYSPYKSISKRMHIIFLSLCVATSIKGSTAESFFKTRKWGFFCRLFSNALKGTFHQDNTTWLFLLSTVTVLLLHSKLGLGPEIKLFGLFSAIYRRDLKALFPFFCFFYPHFPLLAFRSEMI